MDGMAHELAQWYHCIHLGKCSCALSLSFPLGFIARFVPPRMHFGTASHTDAPVLQATPTHMLPADCVRAL